MMQSLFEVRIAETLTESGRNHIASVLSGLRCVYPCLLGGLRANRTNRTRDCRHASPPPFKTSTHKSV
jgi:hypothetical protein